MIDQPLRLRRIYLNVSTRCNMACDRCYGHVSGFEGRAMMDQAVARRATEVFVSHRDPRFPAADVVLFGGEPLLNWPLIEAYVPWVNRRYRESGLTVSLFTNSVAATESHFDFILSHGGTVFVSLDGDFERHRIRRPVSREQFDHVIAMIHHGVGRDPARVVPYAVLRRDDVNQILATLDFIAALGVQSIAVARDQHEDWTGEDRAALLSAFKQWRWRRTTSIRVFPDFLGGCADCSPVGMMVYPSGDVFDLCHVCSTVLCDRGQIDREATEVTRLGHLDCSGRLGLDREAKRRVIRARMDCRTLHATAAEYASISSPATRAEQTAGVLAGLVDSKPVERLSAVSYQLSAISRHKLTADPGL
jgi:pyruvate-formate lyase-activating enzyme